MVFFLLYNFEAGGSNNMVLALERVPATHHFRANGTMVGARVKTTDDSARDKGGTSSILL